MKTLTVHNLPSMATINKVKKRYTAVSTFSGMGGASIGMKLAGFDVRYANEFVPIAADTYALNHPDTHLDRRDIRTVKGKEILKIAGLKVGQLDLYEGSPPCKAFSATQSRKKGRDFGEEIMYSEGIKQRVDDLFFEYTRQIKEMRPKTFIGENVEGLVKKINQGYFVEIFDQLQDLGYRVEAAVIDASLLGVPQRRRRLIYMGVRDDLNLDPVFPTPLGYETTVQEVLPHIARVKNTKGFVSAATHASPTITASDHSIGLTANFSCGGFVETVDGEVRKYTIKELKAISGVPSDFKMIGNFKQKWERLGRIHVPIQVYYLAASLRDNVLAKL